jgi:hypothetical protein
VSEPVPVADAEKVAVCPSGTAAFAGWEMTVGGATEGKVGSRVLDDVAFVKSTALQPPRKAEMRNAIPRAKTGLKARPRFSEWAVLGAPADVELIITNN